MHLYVMSHSLMYRSRSILINKIMQNILLITHNKTDKSYKAADLTCVGLLILFFINLCLISYF